MTTFNPRKIVQCMSYEVKELAHALGSSEKTIFRWIEQGLEVVDPNTKPLLIMGKAAKEFIKSRNTKRRVRLERHESYCLKCKGPRRAKRGTIEEIGTLRKGLCSVCNTKMCKTIKPSQKDYPIPSSPVQMSIFTSKYVIKQDDKSTTSE